jgi:uncharacterized membrane protein YgcG
LHLFLLTSTVAAYIMADAELGHGLASLARDGSRHYEAFNASLDNAAANVGTEHYPGGLLDLGVSFTPERWATTYPGVAYPTLPDEPADPVHENATSTALWNDRRIRHRTVLKGVAEIRKALLRETCDDTLRDELAGLEGGLAKQTLTRILAYFQLQFGVLSLRDLRVLAAQANTMRFTSTATFRAEAAKLALIFAQLARQNQPFSELSKMEFVRQAAAAVPAIVVAIEDYDRECMKPPRSIGTYVAMVKHVGEYDSVTAQDLGFPGNPFVAAAVVPLQPQLDVAALNAFVHAAAAQPALSHQNADGGRGNAGGRGGGRNGRGGGRNGRGDNGRNGRGGGGRGTHTAYCFHHGYGTHTGAVCIHMHNDATYTQAMKAATFPHNIDGWNGSVHTA